MDKDKDFASSNRRSFVERQETDKIEALYRRRAYKYTKLHILPSDSTESEQKKYVDLKYKESALETEKSNSGNFISSVIAGAATGAMIGSIVPAAGSIVGSFIGAAILGYLKSRALSDKI